MYTYSPWDCRAATTEWAYTHTNTADSLCCTAETNTTLKQSYSNNNIFFFFFFFKVKGGRDLTGKVEKGGTGTLGWRWMMPGNMQEGTVLGKWDFWAAAVGQSLPQSILRSWNTQAPAPDSGTHAPFQPAFQLSIHRVSSSGSQECWEGAGAVTAPALRELTFQGSQTPVK